jgi:hypothetical protein
MAWGVIRTDGWMDEGWDEKHLLAYLIRISEPGLSFLC